MEPELKNKILKWIEQDINKQDKQELQNLLESAENNDKTAKAELEDRFSGILQFGTAGLRGKMEAGPNRMCSSVVAKTAYSIGEWGIYRNEKKPDILECGTGLLTSGFDLERLTRKVQLRVVIGFDARYNSKDFAILSAKIFMKLGYDVFVFKNHCPTPVLAYSIKKLKADIGIMVTASHNPAADNGYKVYLGDSLSNKKGDGAQIIPPTDTEIAQRIKNSPDANKIEQSDNESTYVPDDITDNYIKDACTYNFDASKQDKNISIVYTAMHGVGKNAQIKALNNAGYKNIHLVNEQVEPDPDFPTVSFPNPEEDGAMDLSIKTAKENEAALILANDPDADRIAVGVLHKGEYVLLTGDEVGIILTNYYINKIKTEKLNEIVNNKCISSSIVSSTLPKIMCNKNNVQHYSTLTGLKWIVRAPNNTKFLWPNIIFGYEEALGYCTMPNKVNDKDGISTGVLITHIAAESKKQSKTLVDFLTDIAKEYGLYTQSQLSVRLPAQKDLSKLVEKFRKNPPKTLLGEKVKEVVDMLENPPEEHLKQNAILIVTDKKTRVFIRPSGTEPKVKFYLEVVGKPNDRAKNMEKLELLKKELE